MSREPLKRLSDAEVVALRCKGGEWPRGLRSGTPIPDTWMGLVVGAGGQRRFVPAGEDPRAGRDDTLVLVRNRAITVPVDVADTPACDGHAVRGSVELLVRWPARDDDLAALYQTLLSDDELTLERLTEAIGRADAPAALRRFVQAHAAEQLVHGDVRADLLEHLRSELKRFLFSAGLILERLGELEFASKSLTHTNALQRATARRVRELEARGVVEQAALAVTHRRLDSLGDVLDKLKAAAEADAGLQWRDLLPTLTPSERGRLLENLWRLMPDRTMAAALVVVVGFECVWLDPAQPERIVRRSTLPDELGGLRSVTHTAGDNTLLVGAASGVWRISAESGEIRAKYVIPDSQSPRTGVNASAVSGERLFATHSQLGAWSWKLDDPDDVLLLLQPAGGVPRTIRAVTLDDQGHVLLAADDRVHAFSPDAEPLWQSRPTDGVIHCLAPLENTLYAGTASGALQCCDLVDPGDWAEAHRTLSAIESISARRWDDLVELVIPAGPQGVHGVYAEEGIVSRLLDTPTPVRRVWACDDTLAALSEHRDKLIVLNGAMPERTGVEVPVARLVGRSIQDACIVESHEAPEPRSDDGDPA